MKTEIEKSKLLTILKDNRTKHADEFEKARAGYRRKAAAWLEDQTSRVAAGKSILWHMRHLPDGDVLSEPVNQDAEYEKAIMMVEMHTGSTFELDEKAFANMVMDKWHWREHAKSINSNYL